MMNGLEAYGLYGNSSFRLGEEKSCSTSLGGGSGRPEEGAAVGEGLLSSYLTGKSHPLPQVGIVLFTSAILDTVSSQCFLGNRKKLLELEVAKGDLVSLYRGVLSEILTTDGLLSLFPSGASKEFERLDEALATSSQAIVHLEQLYQKGKSCSSEEREALLLDCEKQLLELCREKKALLLPLTIDETALWCSIDIYKERLTYYNCGGEGKEYHKKASFAEMDEARGELLEREKRCHMVSYIIDSEKLFSSPFFRLLLQAIAFPRWDSSFEPLPCHYYSSLPGLLGGELIAQPDPKKHREYFCKESAPFDSSIDNLASGLSYALYYTLLNGLGVEEGIPTFILWSSLFKLRAIFSLKERHLKGNNPAPLISFLIGEAASALSRSLVNQKCLQEECLKYFLVAIESLINRCKIATPPLSEPSPLSATITREPCRRDAMSSLFDIEGKKEAPPCQIQEGERDQSSVKKEALFTFPPFLHPTAPPLSRWQRDRSNGEGERPPIGNIRPKWLLLPPRSAQQAAASSRRAYRSL